jgi:phosphoenolpyruvate phosphomutase
MSDVTTRSDALRQLLEEKRPLRFLEAHNGISALIVENTRIQQGDRTVQYDGIWVSSFTDSAAKGIPDAEIIGLESRSALVGEISNVTSKPIIVDADTGGSIAQFQYYVKQLERAGASGLVLEDKVFPKLNSLDPDAVQKLEDPRVFSQKIQVGKTARSSADFMIIARLESLTIGSGLDDAVRRAKDYVEAGSDGIMIHSRAKNADEILGFAKQYDRLCDALGHRPTLVCTPTTYNSITDEELGKNGFQIIIHANQMLRSSYKTMKETAENILMNDRGFEADTLCSPVSEIFRAVGFYDLKEQDEQTARLRNLSVIIPAAGRDPIFHATPKSLIQISNKTILDYQLEALRTVGLRKIVLVRGYEGNQFQRDDIILLDNKNYDDRHSLYSLFIAKEYMERGFLLVLSDILFSEEIIKRLLDCDSDIVLVVDNSYRFHRKDLSKELDLVVSRQRRSAFHRTLTPTRMIEVRQVGKKIAKELADNEFIGIAYFSREVAEALPLVYEDCARTSKGRFHEAESFAMASITDFIQELIDRGFKVNGLEVFKGWMEIHNLEDVQLASRELAEARGVRV